MPNRLTADDWIDAGLATLRSDGPEALRAEPLARAMGTTKGSFYWHFDDVPAFHRAVVARWRAAAVAALEAEVASADPADQRLRRYGRSIIADKSETALRLWAQSASAVTEQLAELDAQRQTFFILLLRELGFANPDFAHAMQGALVGLPLYLSTDPMGQRTAFDTLVDTVLALSD